MIRLIDLEVYKAALEIGEKVWLIVEKWDHFNKESLGKQFVRAADSMALNIAEGYGRYFYKENRNFNYYSRGSAFESTTCLRKAFERKLVSVEVNKEMRLLFERYFRLMNGYIRSIGEKKEDQHLKEDPAYYKGQAADLDDFLSDEI